MNWRLKAAIQRACAALPAGQEQVYYLLQRTMGSLRRPADPTPMWEEAVGIISDLRAAGFDIRGARVMEVGTGRRLDMPVAFFLCGAGSVLSADVHRYLKPHLAMQSVQALRQRREAFRELFQRVTDAADLDRRLDAVTGAADFASLLKAARIEYRAPADATRMDIPGGSIDLHTSYTVFEHVPRPVLAGILIEASRLLSPCGVACHHIDFSDHFSHDDSTISAIHFLRFSDEEWERSAGNQFSYHNRLRVHQYRDLYEEMGHTVVHWKESLDPRSLREILDGAPLAPQFRSMPPELLSTAGVRVISCPNRRHP